MVTRHKPTTEQRNATHPAQEADYERLASAVVRAIILKERDVILKLVYFVDFGKDFPKGVLIHKDDKHNWYRAKAFRLADWLHSIGRLPTNAKGVVLATRQMVYLEAKINKILIDSGKENCHNDVSVDEGGKNASDDDAAD